jgi:hypothetical protein
MNFFRILRVLGIMVAWAEKALMPDADGVARISVNECTDLITEICRVMDWKAEIML